MGGHLPNVQITFGKFHVIAQASRAVDLTRRAEQKHNPRSEGDDPQSPCWHYSLGSDPQNNELLKALNGLFQAAKRKARKYTRLNTARTVMFLLAGKLDCRPLNPHAHA